MQLRISLIIVLLTGVSAIAIMQFVLRPKVNGLIEARARLRSERDQHIARANMLNALFKEASQTTVQKEAQLNAARAQLATAQAESGVLRERNQQLGRSLDQASGEIRAARQHLAQLAVLGLSVEQAAGLFKSNQVLVSRVASLETEKAQLARDYRILKKQWDVIFTDSEFVPELPAVNGKVLAVDPKWQFVVLDVGTEHGMVPKGVLTISRGSRLVGKARLTRVEADRSIADLLPGWNLRQVEEGDQVF